MVSVPYLRSKSARQIKREAVQLSQHTEDDFESLLVLGPPSQEEFARISRNELEGKQSGSTLKVRKRSDEGFPGEYSTSATVEAAGRTPTARTPLVIVTVTSVVDVTPTVTATVLEVPTTTSTSIVLVSETTNPVTVLSTLTIGATSTTDTADLVSGVTPTSTGVAPSFTPQTTDTDAPIFGGPSSGPAEVVSTASSSDMGASVIVVNSAGGRQPLTTTTPIASSESVFGGSMTSQINLVSTASSTVATAAPMSVTSAAASSVSESESESIFAPTPSQVNVVSTQSSVYSPTAVNSAAPVASSSADVESSSSEVIFSTSPSQVALVSTTTVAAPTTTAFVASSSSSATSDKIFSTTQSQAAVVSTAPTTTILSTLISTLPASATSAPVASASAITDTAVFSTSGAQTAVVASLASQASSASSALSVLIASISSVSIAAVSSSIASVSSVASVSAAASSATVDSPQPGVVTSALSSGDSTKSGSKTKTSSGASASQTGAAGTTGESTATFFSQIGKSPVSITLTVLVCLGILAVLLGIVAFFVRRCHRRRRKAAVGAILLDSPDEKWDGEFAEDPFTDDGESAADVLPGAIWARRGGPRGDGGGGAVLAIQEYSPRDLQGVQGSPMTERTGFTGFTTQRPSSDWTSIIGDHEYETEDDRSKRGSVATDLLQVPGYSTRGGRRSNAPPMPPPHPLATSYVPDTPSAYSNQTTSLADSESNGSHSGSESDDRLLRNMTDMAATPPRQYNTFKNSPPILPNRSRESWRLSLDRVMANAAEFVGAKALMEVDEDNYTQFAKSPRRAPPPPISIQSAQDPRDIPANFTPLSSSYSDRFAFSPDRPNSLPRFAIAPPTPLDAAAHSLFADPTPLRKTRSGSDMSYLSAYYRREDGSSSQGHSSDASGSTHGGSQSGSPQLGGESMSRWGSAESGADTVQPIEPDSDSDRSGLSDKSWQVVPPTSRNASTMNLHEQPSKLMMDPPLPPVAPLFSPAPPFSAQMQPVSALTRAATLDSRRTYYSDGDDSQRGGTVRAHSMRRASYDSGTTIGQRSPLPYLQHAVTGQRAQAHRSSVSTFGGRDSDVEGGSDEASTSTESQYDEPSGAELDRLRRASVVSELMLERRRKSDTPIPVFK